MSDTLFRSNSVEKACIDHFVRYKHFLFQFVTVFFISHVKKTS